MTTDQVDGAAPSIVAAEGGNTPASWSDALPLLEKLESAGEIVTQVVVPFDGAPEQWITNGFTATISRGESFSARLTNGDTIRFN